ncbi:MAG: hypothetical protein ACI3YF_04170, partial [Prevotella sp.]
KSILTFTQIQMKMPNWKNNGGQGTTSSSIAMTTVTFHLFYKIEHLPFLEPYNTTRKGLDNKK